MSIPLHFQTIICDTQVFSSQRYQVESLFRTIYSRNCVIKLGWIMKHFICQKTRRVSGVDVYVNIQLPIHIRFVHTNILSVKQNLDWNILMRPSQWPCNLRGGSVATPFPRYGFESCWGHWCFLWVVYCQVEVSALGWSLTQRISTKLSVSNWCDCKAL
jgi:hypothetical protein